MKKIRTAINNPAQQITRGSGNVFVDLGFTPAQAADLQVKAELTRQIHHRIEALGMTQIQAARRLGISQPDVSKLMNARFTGFSTDRLISLLSALEVDIDIVVSPRRNKTDHTPGVIRVRAVA